MKNTKNNVNFLLGNIRRLFIWLFVTFMAGPTYADLPATIEKIKPSIVGVGRYNELASPRAQVAGTGFVVGDGTLVVTNHHVVRAIENETEFDLVVFIGTGNTPEVRKVAVLNSDPIYDLAILKLPGKPLPALTVSETKVREGEDVAFIGFPIGIVLGLYPVTHRGIISSITPIAIPASTARGLNAKLLKRLRTPFDVYQLDATAYPGNSGSPMFNPETGEILGVINKVFVKESKEAVLEKPSGITYAIPALYLKQMMD
ncbi:serine protease [Hahella sp. CCB-MM4]|uniref:S1 family peptidase n=1 Tax=Hahella sp. (strain CCB-MM4) TaxID=1926491 RepID=UPI000B9AD7FE|nr:serine protease [Hahella sp. CCB-MM4]OZG73408.1 serine protease [Hahella sp. CCB-MM4]